MSIHRSVRSILVGAGLSLGIACGGSAASAADLPVKAAPPPPAATLPFDVHGFFDVSFRNDYITPRGLLVTNTGLTTQVAMGLALDLYKDPSGFINDISFNMGVWNDLWSLQNDPHVGAWNEFDWWVGATIAFARDWKFGVTYIEFLPPASDLKTSFPSDERNVELSLSYSDAWTGWWLTFNPYVKLFYAASGPSTVVLGKGGGTYDVELGFVPTVNLKKVGVLPWNVTLMAPTWVTVGPSTYWNKNDGTTKFCGPLSNAACATSNAGVFSTGLTGKLPIDFLIPARLGNWYVDGGFQYYHIINDALLGAQVLTGSAGGASNVAGTFPSSHRDVVVGFAGFGFTF